jgi:hypothetical protein
MYYVHVYVHVYCCATSACVIVLCCTHVRVVRTRSPPPFFSAVTAPSTTAPVRETDVKKSIGENRCTAGDKIILCFARVHLDARPSISHSGELVRKQTQRLHARLRRTMKNVLHVNDPDSGADTWGRVAKRSCDEGTPMVFEADQRAEAMMFIALGYCVFILCARVCMCVCMPFSVTAD